MRSDKEIDVNNFIKKESKVPILDSKYKYLTPKEYAIMTGKHHVTIAKWLAAGKIEGAIKYGGRWLIPVKN